MINVTGVLFGGHDDRGRSLETPSIASGERAPADGPA